MLLPPTTKLGGRDNQCDLCEKHDAKHFGVVIPGGMVPLKLCDACFNKTSWM